MSCKAGMVVTVVHSTPKLEEAWQKVKNFGVGSSVDIYKVEGEEAVVIFKSGNRSEKVKLPLMCLSCYTTHPIPTGAVWEGTNKELRPLPETPGDEAADLTVPSAAVGVAVGAPEQSAEAEIPGQRICGTCGAMVSEVDTMCNVCGGMMPSVRTEPLDSLGELEEPAPAESRSCPSCGAIVGPDAVECPICETPFEAVEQIKAEKPVAAAVVVAPVPVPKKSKDKESKKRAPEPEPLPAIAGRTCPSCGAEVGPDAVECPVCETPFKAIEQVEAETPAAVVVAPVPVPKKSKEQKEPKEPKQRAPEPEPSEPERVCPSCGAVVEPDATECLICETVFVRAKEEAEPEAPVAAAVVVPVAAPTISRGKPVPEEQPGPEIVCAGCGAVLDAGAEECFICGAKQGEEPAPVSAAVPVIIPKEEPEMTPEEPAISEIEEAPEIPPEELHMTAPPPRAEIVCAGCGAVLDEGAEECFICGVKVGEEPTEIPEATPEPVMARKETVAVPEPEVPTPEVPEPKADEIILGENEIQCPSCSSVIPADSEKCPECWTDLALYAKCPACGKLTPAGEETCRECFATISTAEVDKAMDEELGLETGPTFAEEVEITEELKEEMTFLETEEEQGKECLVCGAIFGPDDQLCPICGIAYGVVIDEPEVPETPWEHMEVGLVPTVHTCPSCGTNVTGLEATEREVKESNWFYRGLVAIFVGIFFTSFSIYARGVSVENDSLGLNPPPTDVVLNLVGWILVLLGFIFWFMSWRLHGQRLECPSCGIETDPGMAVCINCGAQLTDEEEPAPGEDVEEELLPKEESVKDQYNLLTNKPLQYKMPPEDIPPEEVQEILPEEALQDAPPAEEPADFADQEVPAIPEEPAAQETPAAQPKAPEARPEHFEHGEDIPIDHEEHRKCPGCGIFIDVNDTVCPICDTPIGPQEPVLPEPAPEPLKDRDIEVPSEEEELASLDLAEPAPDIDNITVPEENGEQIECPSCGASLEPGTKACPVCEYPITE